MPSRDWDFIGEDDLGSLDGECEYCGKELRYTHMVTHPNWGTMIVGAQCCDKLTESTIGSESHVGFLNYVSRRKTFIDSRKWKSTKSGEFSIERAGIIVKIAPTADHKYRLEFDEAKAKTIYESKIDAQICAFDLIESGAAESYLIDRRQRVLARLFNK